jgi:threonine 3-dehydrogenase
MKALVKSQAKKCLCIKDIAMPEIGNDDVLIRIRKTEICGTDLHIYGWNEWVDRNVNVPMTIGHEYSSEIVMAIAGNGIVTLLETINQASKR